MTIHQLREPCWVIEPNPWGDDESAILHYPTQDEAAAGLDDLRDAREDDPEALAALKGATTVQEARPCWVVDCDRCGERFHDEEAGGSHFGEPVDFAEFLKWDGWATTPPDGVLCYADSPADAPSLPSAADLEAAGQLPLPGVA